MLGVSNEATLSEETWSALASRVELPFSWQEFVAEAGVIKNRAHSRRKFVRVGLRQIAILSHDGQMHAAYTKNLSRIGLAFYSPVQLLPLAAIRVWILGHPEFQLTVRRCRRLQERCFECGAVFN
jgi:hypothetical protein